MHTNWNKTNFLSKIGELAARRNLKDLTIAPTLSLKNNEIKAHIEAVL